MAAEKAGKGFQIQTGSDADDDGLAEFGL